MTFNVYNWRGGWCEADWPTAEFDRLCAQMGYDISYQYNQYSRRTVRHLRRPELYHVVYELPLKPSVMSEGSNPTPMSYQVRTIYTPPEHIVDRDYFGYVDLGKLLDE